MAKTKLSSYQSSTNNSVIGNKKRYSVSDMWRAYDCGKHDGKLADMEDLLKELE